jgi:hypothetical protein
MKNEHLLKRVALLVEKGATELIIASLSTI